MKILELFKKFLGLKQPVPALPAPDKLLMDIIRDALTLNLKSVAGLNIEISVTRINPETFEKHLSGITAAYIASSYGRDEVPCSQFFMPSDSAHLLLEKMRQKRRDVPPDDDEALSLLLDRIEGNLFYMFLPDQTADSSPLRLKHQYEEADFQAVMWGISDCLIFQLEDGIFKAWIAVPADLWNKLGDAIADKDYQWRLRSIAVTEYSGPDTSPVNETVSIRITRPEEFLLGRFFLPGFIKLNEIVLGSVFKKISAGTDVAPVGTFRVSLDIKADGSVYIIWYFFVVCTINTFNELAGSFDNLFKAILRDTVANIRSACPAINITGIRYKTSPAGEPVSDSVILHAELNINHKPVSTLVAVPPEFINLIALHTLENIKLLHSTPLNRVLSVLSVSRALFSKGIGSFLNSYRGADKNLPELLSCMPFYQFMELISDSDLKIVAQNFILPAFSSSYMRLFRIGVTDDSASGLVRRLYTVNSDWQRINRFLPRIIVEDALAGLHWTSADRFDELNRQTMTDLYSASDSGRLLLSARAKFILRNQFFDAMQEECRADIESLKSTGEPFVSFEKMPYNIRQLSITGVNDRDLSLFILWAGDKREALTPLLSRSRRLRIMEDVDILRKQHLKGMITPCEFLRAIRAVQESLEKERVRASE
jgi:hypothetical protein